MSIDGDVYNTSVYVNGNRVYSSSYYPGKCCCNSLGYNGSFFGYGFCNMESMVAMNLGFMAGYSLMPFMPSIIEGIGKGIAKGACAIAKGVSNLWNKVFHKKAKPATKEITNTEKTTNQKSSVQTVESSQALG